jgi:hypothetical protein
MTADGDDQLADPSEHPEQHAALQTGKQAASEPESTSGDNLLDSEEHHEGHGPFGTAEGEEEED